MSSASLRFFRMTSNQSTVNRTVTFANPPSSSRHVSAPVPTTSLDKEIMNAALAKAISAEAYPGGIQALTDVH
ncbi:hypothetical protein FPV67DRAFT_1671185 [Lyophyllum atratum]|nr:hypothetical protein FPV67DRAFT_1671185 [Lyophyllum atratum]